MNALRLTELATRLVTVVGASRARQIRWVAGELLLFAADHPVNTLEDLMSTKYLTDYLMAADAGALRVRRKRGIPSPLGSRRVRRACLVLLAQAAGVPDIVLPPAVGSSTPSWMPALEARRALTLLTSAAMTPKARPALIRAALIASLVHDHDLRVSEIAALLLVDIDLPEKSLTYVPDPPGQSAALPPVTLNLTERTLVYLRLWLTIREGLVRGAGGRTRTLFVSVHGNHTSRGAKTPAGLPLMTRGVARAHVRAVEGVNNRLADRQASSPTWRPIPRTLGSLRPE